MSEEAGRVESMSTTRDTGVGGKKTGKHSP